MNGFPIISIIIPVYNVEKYIRKCLDSVVVQTYDNLEIILIDDGSKDRSGEICDEYAEKDKRIKVIHQVNSGVSAARNSGLRQVSGEFVGMIDADDWIEPDMYSYLFELITKHNADIAQCAYYFESETQSIVQYSPENEVVIRHSSRNYTRDEWKLCSFGNWNKLYRRSVLFGISYNSDYIIGEDFIFNTDAMANSFCFAAGTQSKYHYLQRPESACNSVPSEAALVSRRNAVLLLMHRYADDSVAYIYFKEELIRNNLDICSKIVCYKLGKHYAPLIREIRGEVRLFFNRKLSKDMLTREEKLKCFFIGYMWTFYNLCLPIWKKLKRG